MKMKILSAAIAACLAANTASAALLTGVTDENQLITFDTNSPHNLLLAKPIVGLASNETVRGVDYRPTTAVLYALGSFGNLYTVDPSTPGVATATLAYNLNANADLIADGGLSGTNFGVDFNPAADKSGSNSLRIVSNTDQNLAVNVDTGAVLVATDVSYGGSPAPNIAGEAYINSSLGGADSTTQYAIDSGTDFLVNQAFNAGTLTNIGSGLGVNANADLGFEIVAFSNGTNQGFASIDTNGSNTSDLYSIDLGTGLASFIGEIDGGILVPNLTSDPTLRQNQIVPEPTTLALGFLGLVGLATRRRR